MSSFLLIRTIPIVMALTSGVITPAGATLYYATNITTPEASGALASGGVNLDGGLCILNSPGCISGAAAPLTGSGLIALGASPSIGIANYALTVNIFGIGTASYGSIWDVTLVDGVKSINLGYTNVVGLGMEGSGTIRAIVSGGGSFTIGITNLTEQYYGQQDTLPGVLDGNLSDPLNGGTVATATSALTLTYSLTPAPEPGSLVLLGGGAAGLCVLRRRRRGLYGILHESV